MACENCRGAGNLKLLALAHTSTRTLKQVRAELRDDGCALLRSRAHGMIVYRAENPPPNRTPESTRQACYKHLDAMTFPVRTLPARPAQRP